MANSLTSLDGLTDRYLPETRNHQMTRNRKHIMGELAIAGCRLADPRIEE
jgi:hypothetical protein